MLLMRILIIIAFICLSNIFHLQSEDNFISYPKAYESGSFNENYGLEISRLPNSIGEDMFQQLPLLAVDMRYGLPSNISMIAKLRTVFLTSSVSIGALWSFGLDNLPIAVGGHFMYWYGFAEFSSMDASASGFVFYPNISIGYEFDNLYITLIGEASLTTLLTRQVSNIEVETAKMKVYGWRGSLIIEQPIYDETFLSLGFQLNYTRYHYPSWLAFTTTKHWLLIPEFHFGIKL
jgi:hypothetical protein